MIVDEAAQQPFLERQDELTLQFLNDDAYIKNTDLTHAFNVEQLDFTPNTDQPIQNYHPAWIAPPEKKTPNLGHLSDVHISSRQHAFRKSQAQLIHGASDPIGPMVNTSFDTLKHLMDEFGTDEEIDLLIFTGDLIDYNRNYHPKDFVQGKKTNTGELWQAMDLGNLNHPGGTANTDDYPRSIDNVLMYSLILYYYQKYGKPIFLTSGNHEAYTMPYGISSRVKFTRAVSSTASPTSRTQEEVVELSKERASDDQSKQSENGPDIYDERANEGIPADHNLTITEAVLMYGPDYARVVMSGGKDHNGQRNFKDDNLDWFYMVFTPLSNYTFTWQEQCFIALEWGSDEKLAAAGTDGHASGVVGGFLPRANQSITDRQKQLIEQGLEQNKPCTVLLSHFTLANYNTDVAIGERGEINFNDTWSSHGPYDYGTFENNRKYLYRAITKGQIHYTLSGHSHRAGLYTVEKANDGLIRSNLTVQGHAADPNNKRFKVNSAKAKLIVSASGGPIPVQNHGNELANRGLDIPSGTYIKFDKGGKEQEIGLKTAAKVTQARPRLAVALDFADILGAEKPDIGPVFTGFSSAEDNGPFTLVINPKMKLPDVDWIGGIKLYTFPGTEPKEIIGVVKKTEYSQFSLAFPKKSDNKLLSEVAEYKQSLFISIIPKGNLNDSTFGHYEQTSAWTYQVEIIPRKQIIQERYLDLMKINYDPSGMSSVSLMLQMQKEMESARGYVVRRHSKYGEIPDYMYYSENFGDEYAYPWDTKKKGGNTKS